MSKYKLVFGLTYSQVFTMPRKEFAKKFGKEYLTMSNSKFRKSVIRRANESWNKKPKLSNLEFDRIKKILQNAKGRCKYASPRNTEYYIKKGIRCFLTLSHVALLWIRDQARKMDCPSLDRIDSNKDYRLGNCRFVEFSENRFMWANTVSQKQQPLSTKEMTQ